jgi:hypothetical protein
MTRSLDKSSIVNLLKEQIMVLLLSVDNNTTIESFTEARIPRLLVVSKKNFRQSVIVIPTFMIHDSQCE